MPSHPRTVLEMIFLEAIALQAKGHKVALTSSPNPSKQQRGKTKQERCYRCGQEGHFSKDKCCQASQTTCIKCKKVVHYAILCKTKPSSDSATRGQSSGKRRVLVETEYQEGVFEEEALIFTVNNSGKDGPASVSVLVILDQKGCKTWKLPYFP